MHRLLLLLIALVTVTATAASHAAPRLVCDAPVFEFGALIGQEEVRHVFVLRNDGDEPLQISRVRPTCGCTTAGLGSYTLAPGATTELATVLSLKGRRGEQRKAIYVDSNDPASPQYRLELAGEVRHHVDFRPSQAFLQRTDANPTPEVEVQLIINGAEPRNILKVDASGAPTCVVRLREERPGFLYTLVIQVQSNLTGDLVYRTENVVVHTDHPEQPQVVIPVLVHQLRDVVVAPNQLIVPLAMPASGSFQQQILIRNRTPEALEVVSVTGPTNLLTLGAFRLADAMHRIEVNFTSLSEELDGQFIDVAVRRKGADVEHYQIPIHRKR